MTTLSSSGWPDVSVPVLSSNTVFVVPSRSSAPASFDDDARPCGAREPCDESDRRREDQWAGGCDDHHREALGWIAGSEPGEPGDEKREREEVRGVAIGEPREPCAVDLGRADETDDRGVRALGRRRSHAEVERISCVRRPRANGPVVPDGDRQGLSGECRLVENGFATRHGAVGGDDLARANRDEISGYEGLDQYLLQAVTDVAVRATWCSLDQETELAAGASGRPRLEGSASGHHEGDDRGREELAERECPDDCDERDRVHSDVAAEERARRRDHERHEHDDGADRPGCVGPAILPTCPESGPRHDRPECDRRKAAVAQHRDLVGEDR